MKQIALDIGLAAGPSLRNFMAGPNLAALEHLVLWCQMYLNFPLGCYLHVDFQTQCLLVM